MAVTTAVCNQFKADLLGMATHAAGNTYKLALVKLSHGGTYGAGTISVGATVDGTGTPTTTLLGTDAISASNSTMGTYDVTGFTLSGFSATLQTATGCLDFSAPSAATGTTISAVGALLYNSTQATGKTLAAYDFGGTIASTAGNFTISVPAVGASTSMIRIA
jgi:hypothetical protein